MRTHISRRHCIIASASAAAGLAAIGTVIRPARAGWSLSDSPPASFPSQDPSLVREIVGASHGKIDRVRELLKGSPRLANCAYDWGFGDWETPLGAASHTGRVEIAHLLLDHDARPDIFALAMLGQADAVAAMLKAMPALARVRGPHGLTLMHHARAGGEGADAVVELLKAIPEADQPYPVVPIADPAAYLGIFRFGPSTGEIVEIIEEGKDKSLAIRRVGGVSRRLFHTGEHRFHPAGAPDTAIVFQVDSGLATQLAITSPAPLMVAKRE